MLFSLLLVSFFEQRFYNYNQFFYKRFSTLFQSKSLSYCYFVDSVLFFWFFWFFLNVVLLMFFLLFRDYKI
ncbi:hypothetical protein AZO1586R_1723 [Bathymodiolus azoricus thioautotrophic gill symbiont]|uniref:Uncharacterized protein n=1 Tax=Bathymodiolus azoricus thioautotrophic gill symbiont TaxID=235205 RepID=A0ACA8ZRE4_9GAMM|nr:hypothetical protein AZO1586R_1723 [Bathymodiolus azoricus thioautotrophic gill symbiont]